MVEKARANWGSHVEFILTLIGFAVGLGNVWRFPYLCFKNGGASFIVPYFICLVVMGIPLFYMELCFGQFASLGPIKIWIINPAMKGLGFSMVIVSAMIALYYNVIIAVCIHYFFASMTSKLPWSSCDDHTWASCYCRDNYMNATDADPWNGTRTECVTEFEKEPFNPDLVRSPSEEYFDNRVLHITPNLEETGEVRWDLTLCLLLAWLIVFLVLTKGIKSLGKVVYVTAVFPYIILTILLVRGTTLEGAKDGIDFYLTPNTTKLLEADVWSDAAVQIFFSLSACSGGLIAMASYNEFNNNVLRDALMVPLINCGTSFYAGFVIFSTLGFMANKKQVSVADVAAGGPGLAFVAYPEAIAEMPVSPLWSILFFLMMIMLGFSSEFSIVETVLTGLIDEFPFLKRTKRHTIVFRGCACALGFLLGIPMVTQSGFHLLNIVDNATGGFPLLFVGLLETIAIIFIYGYSNFRDDIYMMLGDGALVRYAFIFFAPMWCFITPLGLAAVILFKSYQYVPVSVTQSDIYPAWADLIWWMIVAFSICCVPVWFLAHVCVNGGFKAKNIKKCNQPSPKWGPYLSSHQIGKYEKPKIPSEEKPSPFTTSFSGNDVTVVYENKPSEAVQNGGDHVIGHMSEDGGYDNVTYVQDNAIYTKL